MNIFESVWGLFIACARDCFIQTLILSLCAGLLTLCLKKEQKKLALLGDFVFAVLFYAYLTMVAYGTFLLRTPGFRREVCLLPFHIFLNWEGEKVYILGNFIMMMPLGILVMLKVKSLLRTTLAAFVLSLTIEVTQYVFSVGKTELDDIILNTGGAVVAALAVFIIEDAAKKIKIRMVK